MSWGPLTSLPDEPRAIAEGFIDTRRQMPRGVLLLHPQDRVARKLRMGRLWVGITALTAALMTWIAFEFHSTLTGVVAAVVFPIMLAALYHACVIPWQALARDPRSVFCALVDRWLVQRVGEEFRAIDLAGLRATELQPQLDGGEVFGLVLTIHYVDADGRERREALSDLLAFAPADVERLAAALRERAGLAADAAAPSEAAALAEG